MHLVSDSSLTPTRIRHRQSLAPKQEDRFTPVIVIIETLEAKTTSIKVQKEKRANRNIICSLANQARNAHVEQVRSPKEGEKGGIKST